jgi:sugar-specific transcriptional regulator TrmB
MRTKSYGSNALLQLSDNEQEILDLLEKSSTPLELSRQCTIPRPTIYITLEKLQKRGLAIKMKREGKYYWEKHSEHQVESAISGLQQKLLNKYTRHVKKTVIEDKAEVIIYKGEKAIFNLFSELIEKHAGERMITIQGDHSGDAWEKVFSMKNINAVNKKIKDKKMITELITSKRWFEKQRHQFGIEWAKDFEGRAMRVQNIDHEYLDTSGQIFIFKDHIFLVSMSEEVFIEIKNPHIAKLLVLLSRFIQDHSNSIDANALLRELITNSKTIK